MSAAGPNGPLARPLTDLDFERLVAFLSYDPDTGSQLFRNVLLGDAVLDRAVPQDAAHPASWVSLEQGFDQARLHHRLNQDHPAPSWSTIPPIIQSVAFGAVPAELLASSSGDPQTGAEKPAPHHLNALLTTVAASSALASASASADQLQQYSLWGMVLLGPNDRPTESGLGVAHIWLSTESLLSRYGCGHPSIPASTFAGLSPCFDPHFYSDAQNDSGSISGPTLSHLEHCTDPEVRKAAYETRQVIQWLLETYLPSCFGRTGATTARENKADVAGEHPARTQAASGVLKLHGVSGLVEREATTLALQHRFGLRGVAYRSSCLLFHRAPNTTDIHTYEAIRRRGAMVDDHMQADYLHSSDVPAVQAENHVPFTTAYLEKAARISVCLRDTKPSASRTSEMARAAAWVGTHASLTLASLHVHPEYRRRSTDAQGADHAVGEAMVALYAARWGAAVSATLASLKLPMPVPAPASVPVPVPFAADSSAAADEVRPSTSFAGPSPVSLMASTESANVAGLRFFARLGWQAASGARCWSAIVYEAA